MGDVLAVRYGVQEWVSDSRVYVLCMWTAPKWWAEGYLRATHLRDTASIIEGPKPSMDGSERPGVTP